MTFDHLTSKEKKKISKSAVEHFDLQLSENLVAFSSAFFSMLKKSRNFHLGFLTLFFAQLIALFIFFPIAASSSFLSLTAGGLFLTGFSYFALRFYFSAKKSEEMLGTHFEKSL